MPAGFFLAPGQGLPQSAYTPVARLIDRSEAAGAHVAAWDGSDANGRAVAPGIYFLTLEAGAHSITRKVVRVP